MDHAENAKRHREKASYWRSEGKEAYAKNSDKKAAKFEQKQRDWDYLFWGPYPKDRMYNLMTERFMKVQKDMKESFERAIFG